MSAYDLRAAATLMKKELVEHKAAFVYVPGILIGVAVFTFFAAIWSNGDMLEEMRVTSQVSGKFDLFNLLYAGSIMVWMGYLGLMLFFYFAGSFSADSKNNALLFWKSLPVSDFEIMATKTITGITLLPMIIFGWALVTALAGTIALNALASVSPLIASLNKGVSIWTMINLEISAMVFVGLTLLWQLPLYVFVGLLGTLLRGWAVPAFFLILFVLSALEGIIFFTPEGYFSTLVENRIGATFDIVSQMGEATGMRGPENLADMVAAGSFVPDFLSRINWTSMALGWFVALALVWLASEVRRRQLAD